PVGKARRAALDDHRADAADTRPVAHIDQKNRRVRTEAGKQLAAVDDVMGAVGLRAGLEVGRRRAGVGLADAEGHHNASLQQVGQPAFCCGVPYSAKVRIGPKLPNCTTSELRGQTAATCSMAITASMSVPPWPPSASGRLMPMRPCALISFATPNG